MSGSNLVSKAILATLAVWRLSSNDGKCMKFVRKRAAPSGPARDFPRQFKAQAGLLRFAAAIAICTVLPLQPARATGPAMPPPEAFRALMDEVLALSARVCARGPGAPPVAGARTAGALRYSAGGADEAVQDWRLPDGSLLRLRRTARPGRPVLLFTSAYGGPDGELPILRLVRDGGCTLRGGEHVLYDADWRPLALLPLGRDLRPRAAATPFNPPLPGGLEAGSDAAPPRPTPPAAVTDAKGACVPVAIMDNGLNYLVPGFAERLARREDGTLLGADFWEDDALPFDFGVPPGDLDMRISAFAPPRHGTAVASVLMADAAPGTCIAPYRYSPRDPGNEVGRWIDRIVADGVRVVVLSSGRERPWPAFRDAMRRHPGVLFITAAGNEGRDLARAPVYPMAYALPNHLVVAAATRDGAVWPRSNRGAGLVELAVPAVEISGRGFEGTARRLTGTSFASPRVGALAGLLLSRQDAGQKADGAALKRRILEILAEASGKDAGTGPVTVSEQQLRRVLARLSG
ncbi:hypothetical protein BV394_14280 [Brevirhabdus pacifica]|uniref:Peptidase S8/S53 domain-containing protein n=3 Tax=Brevirhabdus pacifica TaxID=1267768 RepID=A0A1U7DLI6_9RHOB|nr:hypothetical protein BV394_14280 [Brevirhabdus pacifica]OWU78288.1 hypothetical protein ATO5_05170 [Loktanella sp. 22II-4b]PJJ85102.1 subtilase family protein [Brevirhabdus pacifica]